MERCKAATRSGNQCSNKALPGSEYCHILSHQPPIKPKWYRRAWNFIAHKKLSSALLIPLSFSSDTIQVASYITQDNQADIRAAIEPLQHGQERMERKQEERDKILLEELKTNRHKLMGKYPLGFHMFYVDGKQIYAPPNVKDALDADWDTARIIFFFYR